MAKKKASPRSNFGSSAFVELASSDPASTRKFLGKVFRWRFQTMRMPAGEYLSYETSDGGRGGVRRTRPSEPPGSTNYVRVEDLDAATEEVRRAGGEMILPRVDAPGMGSFFWFRVPGGPIMACWQDAPEED